MIKRWLTGLALLTVVSTAVSAQTAFVVDTDYQLISPAVKTTQPDKVVVTEIFWYGCPHCFRFRLLRVQNDGCT
jgi:thiol:disulfide interchange protein DsbA